MIFDTPAAIVGTSAALVVLAVVYLVLPKEDFLRDFNVIYTDDVLMYSHDSEDPRTMVEFSYTVFVNRDPMPRCDGEGERTFEPGVDIIDAELDRCVAQIPNGYDFEVWLSLFPDDGRQPVAKQWQFKK